jgi:hypothetical protein
LELSWDDIHSLAIVNSANSVSSSRAVHGHVLEAGSPTQAGKHKYWLNEGTLLLFSKMIRNLKEASSLHAPVSKV